MIAPKQPEEDVRSFNFEPVKTRTPGELAPLMASDSCIYMAGSSSDYRCSTGALLRLCRCCSPRLSQCIYRQTAYSFRITGKRTVLRERCVVNFFQFLNFQKWHLMVRCWRFEKVLFNTFIY